MDRSICLESLRAPTYSRGHSLFDGIFFKNMEADRVSKKYANDGDPAVYGYRVRPDKWRWRDKNGDGLSVNLEVCACCAACSIHIAPEPSRFMHVLRLDLGALVAELNIQLYASYDPIEPPDPHPNPCHFNILPLDVSIEDLLVNLRDFLTNIFPKEFPGRDAEKQRQALQAKERYERVFLVIRNVYKPELAAQVSSTEAIQATPR